MRTLTSLCLSDNRIKRLENLNLPQLVNLDVSYNKIAVLENLSKLKKLENLNLSYNLLTEAGVSGKAY
jgi:Leucine-rich repeat (LRR) protein